MTLNGPRRRVRAHLTAELLDEMTTWAPAERVRAFRTWLRGSLSLIHLQVLTILEVDGPLSMGRLADALDVSVASLTGIVDRMEERGLVERRVAASDRRVVEVHPTSVGETVFEQFGQGRRANLEAMFARMTDREIASLLVGYRALNRVRAQLTPMGEAGATVEPASTAEPARSPAGQPAGAPEGAVVRPPRRRMPSLGRTARAGG